MDISVNKPVKEFLRLKFQEWYSNKILEQVEEDAVSAEIVPVSLSMPVLKEVGAKWFVEMFEYISDNPQIIVNGFIRAGICGALDVVASEDSGDVDDSSEESVEDYDSDFSEESDEDYDCDQQTLVMMEHGS